MNYDKLEALVKEKGVTKTFLCQIVARERYYLRDCKKNNFITPDEHIAAWADALGTTVEYLTDQTNQKEKPTHAEMDVDDILKIMLNLPREKKEELLESSAQNANTKLEITTRYIILTSYLHSVFSVL